MYKTILRYNHSIKVIGAQGLGSLGDRTKRADRHEVPEESTTKKRGHSTDFKNWGRPSLFFSQLKYYTNSTGLKVNNI